MVEDFSVRPVDGREESVEERAKELALLGCLW